MLAHPMQHDCTFTTFPQPWHPSGAMATSWSVPSTCDLVPAGLGVQSTACVPMCTGEGTEQSELQLAPEQGAGRETAPPDHSMLLQALGHAGCGEQAELARLQREHCSAHTWDGATPVKPPEQTTRQDSPHDCPHPGPAVSPVCPVGLSAHTTPNTQAQAEQGLAVQEAPDQGLSPP